MEKLISMTDFVLHPDRFKEDSDTAIFKVTNYANFLKQPLQLGFFIPTDLDGNVYIDYEEYSPKNGTVCAPYEGLFEVSRSGKDVEFLNEAQLWKDDQRYYNKRKYDEALKAYNEAKERVLFEGFEADYFNKEDKGSFQVVDEGGYCQICVYKAQPNYFVWNNGNGSHPTIEDLVKYGLTLTETAKKQILG